MSWRRVAVVSSALVVACALFPDVGATGPRDGGGNADAGGGGDADAAGGGFCASSTHAFCADFDVGTLIAGWTNQAADAPATLALATDLSVSPSRSFLATMPRRAASAPAAYAVLEENFTGWKRTVIEFEFFAKTPDWQSTDVNSGIVVLGLYSDSINDGVTVSMGQAYTTLGAPNNVQLNSDPLPIEGWAHAHIDVDPSGSVDATLGTVHLAGTFPAVTPGTSPYMTLMLGISGYNQPAPEYRVYYDNVTVDFP